MYKFIKRLIDIVVSFIAIVFLLPISIPVMLLLKLTDEGEIFYFQERIGFKNEKFLIWKFATMLKNSMNLGTGSITLKNDFRVTKIGKFLRKTKLNELPQLINIFKGDLSIIGPRPLVQKDFDAYSEKIKQIVYNVKPGLTGVGSIVFRDEESLISEKYDKDPHIYYKNIIAPYKGELEIWYQQNKSISLDLKLIFLTAWVVLFPNSNLHFKLLKDLPKRSF